ncbi:hypothetical protein BKA56DRAFT_106085 [Ilyonectria sp. MPI-CAGE-AT-0026]|nr:hypothetical protein BKA56DRAFT_106085 [Ilyonectria sp. MPI-CAGE-AT-0026]
MYSPLPCRCHAPAAASRPRRRLLLALLLALLLITRRSKSFSNSVASAVTPLPGIHPSNPAVPASSLTRNSRTPPISQQPCLPENSLPHPGSATCTSRVLSLHLHVCDFLFRLLPPAAPPPRLRLSSQPSCKSDPSPDRADRAGGMDGGPQEGLYARRYQAVPSSSRDEARREPIVLPIPAAPTRICSRAPASQRISDSYNILDNSRGC